MEWAKKIDKEDNTGTKYYYNPKTDELAKL